MFMNAEQFASATKALFEFQLQTFNVLTSKAVQGVEQVVALNIATAKSTVEDTLTAGKELTLSKDPKAAMELVAAQVQPNVDTAKAYNHQLGLIIKEIQSEFTSAAQAHMAEAKTNLSALIYDVTKNVPPGSENAVQIIKTAIDNAFQGYEQVTKATQEAVQKVEAKIAEASEQVAAAPAAPAKAPRPASRASKK